jgi:tripartite-type tricarboxylate transporter receptor subunit TctC
MLLAAPTLLTGVAASPGVRAEDAYPVRPIRQVAPYAAGTTNDVLTRILTEYMQRELGQPVVVENRVGAGGNVGIDYVAKAAPDGYTFGSAAVSNLVIAPFIYGRMAYDPQRDLVPVSMIWELPNVAFVAPQHCPARTLQEFIAWAKARPHGINYSSPGAGSTAHLCGALLAARQGYQGTHVSFRGAAQIYPALIANDVQFSIENISGYLPMFREGTLRPLAVTSAERWAGLPDVPTMAEAGVPDFVVTVWVACVAPAGTPQARIDKINATLRRAAADETVQQRFSQVGARVMWTSPEAVTARSEAERPMWRDAVNLSGARIE